MDVACALRVSACEPTHISYRIDYCLLNVLLLAKSPDRRDGIIHYGISMAVVTDSNAYCTVGK